MSAFYHLWFHAGHETHWHSKTVAATAQASTQVAEAWLASQPGGRTGWGQLTQLASLAEGWPLGQEQATSCTSVAGPSQSAQCRTTAIPSAALSLRRTGLWVYGRLLVARARAMVDSKGIRRRLSPQRC